MIKLFVKSLIFSLIVAFPLYKDVIRTMILCMITDQICVTDENSDKKNKIRTQHIFC